MVCKKCNAEIPENTSFCGKCGAPATEAEICVRCKKLVDKGLNFCTHCGMPLDGSVMCGVCGEIIAKDCAFCIKCGARTDGKIVCSDCGFVYDKTDMFCGKCGKRTKIPAAVKADGGAAFLGAAAQKRTSEQKTKKYLRGGALKDNRIFKLCKTWFAASIFLLAFCFSFFGYPCNKNTIKLEVLNMYHYAYPSSIEIEIEMKSSPYRAIEALFYFGGDTNRLTQEFSDELEKALYKADISKSKATLKVDYNYLKLEAAVAAQGIDDVGPDYLKIVLMSLQALLPLAIMIASGIYFVLTLLKSIKTTVKNAETDDKSVVKGLSLIAALTVGMLLLGKISAGSFIMMITAPILLDTIYAYPVDVVSSAALNGFSAAILILSLITIVCFAVMHFVFTDAEINVLRLASHGVSLVLLIIILIGIGANLINLTSDSILFNLSASGFGFFFINAETVFGLDDMKIQAYIFSILNCLILLTLITMSVIALNRHLRDSLKPVPSANSKKYASLFFISLALIISAAVGCKIFNTGASNALSGLTVKMTAWPIIVTVFCFLNFIQSFVFAGAEKYIKSQESQKGSNRV